MFRVYLGNPGAGRAESRQPGEAQNANRESSWDLDLEVTGQLLFGRPHSIITVNLRPNQLDEPPANPLESFWHCDPT